MCVVSQQLIAVSGAQHGAIEDLLGNICLRQYLIYFPGDHTIIKIEFIVPI